MKWAAAGHAVNCGIEACLPGAFQRPDRARLYFQALIITAIPFAIEEPDRLHDASLASREPPELDPIVAALRGAIFYAGASYAEREILRRGDKHVGFNAALLELARCAEALGRLFGANRIELAIDSLTRGTRWKAARGMGGLSSDDRRQALEGLQGQAVLTVAARWCGINPLELNG